MKHAIIVTGGKQYRVAEGDVIFVEKLDVAAGEAVKFDQVLAVIDGETVPLFAGDWIRVAPAAKRQFSAAEDSPISFICIQVKEKSLEGFTQDDAVVY